MLRYAIAFEPLSHTTESLADLWVCFLADGNGSVWENRNS